MPLNKKGEKIMNSMLNTYGKKKGKSIFYAMVNAGSLEGVEIKKDKPKKKKLKKQK